MDQPQARVALVTGSSRGLGSAIARRLARDGFAVAVNVTDEGEVEGLAAARQLALLRRQERPEGPRPRLGPLGITVNSVAPGFIPVERHADLPPEVFEDYRATVPIGHLGAPVDIAHAVSFPSDGAGFITGQRIVVDGGRSLGR